MKNGNFPENSRSSFPIKIVNESQGRSVNGGYVARDTSTANYRDMPREGRANSAFPPRFLRRRRPSTNNLAKDFRLSIVE